MIKSLMIDSLLRNGMVLVSDNCLLIDFVTLLLNKFQSQCLLSVDGACVPCTNYMNLFISEGTMDNDVM